MRQAIHIGDEVKYDTMKGVIEAILNSNNSDDVKKTALSILPKTCRTPNVSISNCHFENHPDIEDSSEE